MAMVMVTRRPLPSHLSMSTAPPWQDAAVRTSTMPSPRPFPAVLDAGLPQIAIEDAAQQLLGKARAIVTDAEAEHFSGFCQAGIQGSSGGGEFQGVGDQIQHSPFQLLPICKAIDGLFRAMIADGDMGCRCQSGGLRKKRGEQGTDVRGFLTGFRGNAPGIGHIADNTQHLMQAPVSAEPAGHRLP